jgi:hypothetical protein
MSGKIILNIRTITIEIFGFITGFINNSLLSILGKSKLEVFYNKLSNNIEANISEIRNNQWNHCILELKKVE